MAINHSFALPYTHMLREVHALIWLRKYILLGQFTRIILVLNYSIYASTKVKQFRVTSYYNVRISLS